MVQKHQKVSDTGKADNNMKTAVIEHSTKHEGKGKKKVDLVPVRMRKG